MTIDQVIDKLDKICNKFVAVLLCILGALSILVTITAVVFMNLLLLAGICFLVAYSTWLSLILCAIISVIGLLVDIWALLMVVKLALVGYKKLRKKFNSIPYFTRP